MVHSDAGRVGAPLLVARDIVEVRSLHAVVLNVAAVVTAGCVLLVEVGRVGGAALAFEAGVAVWVVGIEVRLGVVGSGDYFALVLLLVFLVIRHGGEVVVSRAGDESVVVVV